MIRYLLVAALGLTACTKKKEKPPPPAPSATSPPVERAVAPEVFAEITNITHVAADAQFLYVASEGTADDHVATNLARIPKTGGKPARLDPPLPPVHVVDPHADALYLLVKPAIGKGARIERMTTSGATANPSTVIVDTQLDIDTWITSDDRFFYYFAGTPAQKTEQTMNRVPITGGAGQVIARLPEGSNGFALARQGTHLYWATRTYERNKPTTGEIFRLDIGSDAGAPKAIAQIDCTVWHIASDATHLYFTSKPLDATDNEGAVMRVTLADGKVDTWVDKQNRPWAIAIDANAVYWGTEDGLFKREKTSTMIKTLVRGESVANTMVVDDRYVYWATRDRLLRVPKD